MSILPCDVRRALPARVFFFAFAEGYPDRFDRSSAANPFVRLPRQRLGFTIEKKRDAQRVAGDSDHIVAETAARIFADLADPQTVNRSHDSAWKEPLWRALEESGLPLAWVREELGGSGGSLAEGFAVVGAAGRYAASIPLAETLLAGWLLDRAGIACPEGAISVAPTRPQERISLQPDGRLSGQAVVPFASEVRHIAVLAGGKVALVARSNCRMTESRNLAGDPCPLVDFTNAQPLHVAAVNIDFERWMLMGAAVRALQTAGALQTVLSMSVAYANERVAFERKIGKFQAVQQNLARLAGEAAAALAAAGSAADTLTHGKTSPDAVFLEAASAKIRCAEAAEEGSAIAHQVFGAIGFTQEHVLHRFTLRMLGWRDDFGNESWWAAELGRRVAKAGADDFWPLVASR
jgi:acyl-CoA dehydrogenase